MITIAELLSKNKDVVDIRQDQEEEAKTNVMIEYIMQIRINLGQTNMQVERKILNQVING